MLPVIQCAKDKDRMPVELQRHQAALARLERYATLMDARFRVPGSRIRFGLDPIIGLLPGFGDAVGLALSLYVVVEAIRLGVSKRVLFRMLRNVGLEALVGVVPVLGDLFDIGFKANMRNAGLLRSYIEDHADTGSRLATLAAVGPAGRVRRTDLGAIAGPTAVHRAALAGDRRQNPLKCPTVLATSMKPQCTVRATSSHLRMPGIGRWAGWNFAGHACMKGTVRGSAC